MMKINKSGVVFYDEETQTFTFPTPRDPDYSIGIDLFRSGTSILNEVVLHLRDKPGVSDEQIVDLLCVAAAVKS